MTAVVNFLVSITLGAVVVLHKLLVPEFELGEFFALLPLLISRIVLNVRANCLKYGRLVEVLDCEGRRVPKVSKD